MSPKRILNVDPSYLLKSTDIDFRNCERVSKTGSCIEGA